MEGKKDDVKTDKKPIWKDKGKKGEKEPKGKKPESKKPVSKSPEAKKKGKDAGN